VPTIPLTAANALGFMQERGWVGPDEGARVQELSGGVSNQVLLVESSWQRFVVKQALPRLRVRDEWLCAVDRILVEQKAMETLTRLVGGSRLPAVLYADAEQYAFAMTAAPEGSVNWKAELLAGRIDPGLGAAAGELLGRIHAVTSREPGLSDVFADDRFFVDLRVDPYYRTTAARNPDVAGPILEQALRMRLPAARRALVHGDYSPKNMLIAGGDLLLLDFEVAHWGDPSFDVAFCLNHFLLKAIHRRELRGRYLALADRFWHSYAAAAGDLADDQLERTVLRQLGCLLLARVDGKSPVEYLEAEARRNVVRRLARFLLQADLQRLTELVPALATADAEVT
jgi:5-methylthioribose kinase